MTKRLVNVRAQRPWLDIVSYGRRGAQQPLRLTAAEREAIGRTVSRVPEVVIKVTGGGRNLKAVEGEVDYFGREGELGIETDDGQNLQGSGVARELIEDWDLALEAQRGHRTYSGKPGRQSPKLVHNLMFSMPPGTSSQKVLAAARKFAQEKLALKHRYAMVLHTDEKHPHVHMLVKAMSEPGVRLNITKPMLREWRHDFARYLRELGVAANATDRVVRGVTMARKTDGIYRAASRGDSTHMRQRAEVVAKELLKGNIVVEPEKARLLEARREVVRGWTVVGEALERDGQYRLAADVRAFVSQLPRPTTEKEQIAAQLLMRQSQRTRALEQPVSR